MHWTKPPLGVVQYPWNGTAKTPLEQKTNLVLLVDGDPNRGVMYDAHEKNASRRYKAFGSFYSSNDTATTGLCRGKGSKTPSTAVDGDVWPPCHNLGVAYSPDGITFTHSADETKSSNGLPGLDVVGQNDGALDLAMWDEDMGDNGSYWGLVRLDVVGPPNPMPWGGAQGFRRTGRFTSQDFETFTPGEQVFHGRQGYEIYTIQPFRLPSYRPGYYLATAMFYNTSAVCDATEQCGWVNCELLQTTDFGVTWARVAGEGVQFIPRGDARKTSNTICPPFSLPCLSWLLSEGLLRVDGQHHSRRRLSHTGTPQVHIARGTCIHV